MNMSRDQAERWVVISAMIVMGIYAYRRITETPSTTATLNGIIGLAKQPVQLGAFVTAWGFTFLVVSVMATAAPGLGAGFAILIATSDFLANAPAVLGDVGTLETKSGSSTNSKQAAAAAAASALYNPTSQPGTEPQPSSVGSAVNRPSTLPFVGSHGN